MALEGFRIASLDATVINVKTSPHVDCVYIGRGGDWGNPYVIGRDGDREQVIASYKRALWAQLEVERECGEDTLLHELAALHGKRLGCFCAPQPCHGDVLVAAARWAKGQLDAGL